MIYLNEGDVVLDFISILFIGESVLLSDYVGKKLVLYFYFKDDMFGCMVEVCSLRDGYGELCSFGYEILGVSFDFVVKYQKFINKYEFFFDFLVDEDKSVLNVYGVWGEKKFMGCIYDGVY